MRVAWVGSVEFGNWLQTLSGSNESALADGGTEPTDDCAQLVVEGMRSVPEMWSDRSLLRIVQPADFGDASHLPTPLGTVLLKDEAVPRLVELLASPAQKTPPSLHDIVAGPIAHDFRGAVGLIQLVQQILAQSDANASFAKRLSSAVTRLGHLLQELEVVTALAEGDTTPIEASQPWSAALQHANLWREATHRMRIVDVTARDELLSSNAPHLAGVLLCMILDAHLRLTPAAIPIALTLNRAETHCEIRSSAQLGPLPPELAQWLKESLLHNAPPKEQSFLFRLTTAARLVKQWGGEFHVHHVDGTLELVALVPTPAQ